MPVFAHQVEAWLSGACYPRDPGGTGVFAFIVRLNGEEQIRQSAVAGSGGKMTTNAALYVGFAELCKYLKELSDNAGGVIHVDSEMVARQMSGDWQIRSGSYVPFADEAARLFLPICRHYQTHPIHPYSNGECRKLWCEKLKEYGIIVPEVVISGPVITTLAERPAAALPMTTVRAPIETDLVQVLKDDVKLKDALIVELRRQVVMLQGKLTALYAKAQAAGIETGNPGVSHDEFG